MANIRNWKISFLQWNLSFWVAGWLGSEPLNSWYHICKVMPWHGGASTATHMVVLSVSTVGSISTILLRNSAPSLKISIRTWRCAAAYLTSGSAPACRSTPPCSDISCVNLVMRPWMTTRPCTYTCTGSKSRFRDPFCCNYPQLLRKWSCVRTWFMLVTFVTFGTTC